MDQGSIEDVFPLTIFEGMALDFNLYFRAVNEEFFQTCEGIDNITSPRAADSVSLGPCRNL